jgi:hypothetical protein
MKTELAKGPPIRNRLAAVFSSRKAAVLSAALVIWGLTLFDLTLLPRIDAQYLGTLPSKRLVGAAVAPNTTVMTSAGATSPANLWVLTRHRKSVQVIGARLPSEHRRSRKVGGRILRVRMRTTVRRLGRATPIAVAGWAGRHPALFTVSSAHRFPVLRILSLQGKHHLVLESRVPLPPQRTDRRDFFIARWSGSRPDLFVIDRNAERHRPLRPPSSRPWSIRVYSGESGFKRLVVHTLIRQRLSRRLSKFDWSLNIGSRHHRKPSLVLVTKAHITGSGKTEVHILSGQSKFRAFSLHAITEIPSRVSLKRQFVFQSERSGGSVLMIEIARGQLLVRPVPLP